MKAVGADDPVEALDRTARKAHPDVFDPHLEFETTLATTNGAVADGRRKDLEQLRASNDNGRDAGGAAQLADGHGPDQLTVLRAKFGMLDGRGDGRDALCHSQRRECPHPVAPNEQCPPRRPETIGLLKDGDARAGPPQTDSRGEPANAAPDHRHSGSRHAAHPRCVRAGMLS
jgi:hypothetical protein